MRSSPPLTGVLELPGDKSISHRYAILAALAEGTSQIANFSPAADCRRTLGCLERLGVSIKNDKARLRIAGLGMDGLKRPWRALNAGNSGTTMRLLAGVLAGQAFKSTITGDRSLRQRPMRRVIEPLQKMGTKIAAREGNFAPLQVQGRPLHGIEYEIPIPSAQVKSAILLAGLQAEGETVITELQQTRDHLEIALGEFGASVKISGRRIALQRHSRLRAVSLEIPGDLSAAVFFLAACCIVPDSQLVLHNVGLNPTRTAVLDWLISMGAQIRVLSVQMRNGELFGDLSVRHALLEGGSIEPSSIPAMIDELPMLAVLGPFTRRGIEIRGATELRVKESDRIQTLAENLRRLNAQVEEFPDGLRVAAGAINLHGATIDSQGDHRIAMAFAIAALGIRGETKILQDDCVAVSFPNFFAAIEALQERQRAAPTTP